MSGRSIILAAMLLAGGAGAVPPSTGNDPGQQSKIPSKQPPTVPQGVPDPSLFDVLAHFDFSSAPLGEYKVPAPATPDAQQIRLTGHVITGVVPIDGAPQRHVLRIGDVPLLEQAAAGFVSKSFDIAKRKRIVVTLDGQFHPNVAVVEIDVSVGATPSVAALAFSNGTVAWIDPMKGYQPFGTYVGAKAGPSGPLPSEHRVTIGCATVTRACTIAFRQAGKTVTSATFTLGTGPAPAPLTGSQRVTVRIRWPQQGGAERRYDVRSLTISGDSLG